MFFVIYVLFLPRVRSVYIRCNLSFGNSCVYVSLLLLFVKLVFASFLLWEVFFKFVFVLVIALVFIFVFLFLYLYLFLFIFLFCLYICICFIFVLFFSLFFALVWPAWTISRFLRQKWFNRWKLVDRRGVPLNALYATDANDWRKSGVDVMIKIFCDFRQFLAEKWRFFLRNQCYD
jgi:hypothetical protein